MTTVEVLSAVPGEWVSTVDTQSKRTTSSHVLSILGS
jgi:hypothetical protein